MPGVKLESRAGVRDTLTTVPSTLTTHQLTIVEYLDILGGTGTPEGPAGVLGHYKSCPCQVDAESSLRAIPLGTVTVTSRGERNGLSIAASGKCGVIGDNFE